ncbi:hypothetical protein GCM10009122_13630 [Fulvivirga kasyanovii]|uniref:Uncharacterized protein n=1 Tax=Fulvivirga kasyanovii TaxID=396812 RepID=A0ABW9RKP3_9BACT|nr:hypothetical protein [Fulvivirga kasyanovii]MTI24505.1 hypothetical protein [Fulvivirga kasyanovii]
MKAITKKQAILQSLEAMDASEMEKVLDYIKDLLYNPANDLNYQKVKQQAMREIQHALKNEKKEAEPVLS